MWTVLAWIIVGGSVQLTGDFHTDPGLIELKEAESRLQDAERHLHAVKRRLEAAAFERREDVMQAMHDGNADAESRRIDDGDVIVSHNLPCDNMLDKGESNHTEEGKESIFALPEDYDRRLLTCLSPTGKHPHSRASALPGNTLKSSSLCPHPRPCPIVTSQISHHVAHRCHDSL